jgi:archaellum biogenesis ATPase FlaH
MNVDGHILASAIKSRSAFERISKFAKSGDFTPPIQFWYERLCEYYERDKAAQSANVDLLQKLGEGHITNPKQSEGLLAALAGLPHDSSPENIVELVLDLRKRNLVLELATHSQSNDRKKSDKAFTELLEIWDKSDVSEASEVEYAKDWSELDSVVGIERRIRLGVPSLDNRIGGGVLPGHHVLIFGRTEIGKSCLTLAIAASLLRSGQSVLYVGNEDEINILKSRMRLSLLGWTQAQLNSLPKKGLRLLNEIAGDRLTMVKMTPGSMSELEDLAAKHTPSVLVVDQIRNLSGPLDGMTRNMEQNAIRFRSLLNRRKMIGISVTQAGDRSQGHNQDGPLYLSAGDVDSSRVGLPGTADLQIGIGCNNEMLSRGLRMLNFAKNKLSSEPGSREPLIVRFDLQRSMVLDGDQ